MGKDRHVSVEIHDLAIFLQERELVGDVGHTIWEHGEMKLGHRPISCGGDVVTPGCRPSWADSRRFAYVTNVVIPLFSHKALICLTIFSTARKMGLGGASRRSGALN